MDMKTQQNSYKLNNNPGYPFLFMTLEKNDIGLAINSFTSSTLGAMSIIAYSPCFQNDIRLMLKNNFLIIQVGVDEAYDRPFKMHLLDKENQYLLRTGLMPTRTAEIKLDGSFLFNINDYCLVSRNLLQIDLNYKPDFFKQKQKTD
jgi:hypothetical protein